MSFTKTVISLEILSESPIPLAMDVDSILYECTHGDYVLRKQERTPTELNKEDMAWELVAAGSEPEFFGIQTEADPDRYEEV